MKVFKLELLSEHRSAIMGFAMIWVVLYHYQLKGFLSYPFMVGYTGVDLFMFVSGLGLYYSMYKDNDVKHFYRKRLLRILPMYYLIGLAYELLAGDFNLLSYLWKYSTIGFWTDGVYGNGWFIPSIITLYALYPFFYRTLFQSRLDSFTIIVLYSVFTFFVIYNCFIDQTLFDTNHFLLLYRLPIFLLGSILGFAIKEKLQWEGFFVIMAIALFPLLIINYFVDGNVRAAFYSTTFTAPFILIVICLLCNKVRFLRVVGRLSENSDIAI